jgi:hypothetical protein
LFFILVFIVIAGIIAALLFLKIEIILDVDKNDINIIMVLIGFIKITKKYIIIYEEETILSLYFIKGEKLIKVSTLKDILSKLRKSALTEITFINLINIFTQFMRREPRNNTFRYIYKKMNYDLNIKLWLGISDAFATALVCGLVGSASSAVCSILNNEKHRTKISITPEFSKQVISVKINCIIMISSADIITGYFFYIKNRRR